MTVIVPNSDFATKKPDTQAIPMATDKLHTVIPVSNDAVTRNSVTGSTNSALNKPATSRWFSCYCIGAVVAIIVLLIIVASLIVTYRADDDPEEHKNLKEAFNALFHDPQRSTEHSSAQTGTF